MWTMLWVKTAKFSLVWLYTSPVSPRSRIWARLLMPATISGVAGPNAPAPPLAAVRAAMLAPKQLSADGLASAGLMASAIRQFAKVP